MDRIVCYCMGKKLGEIVDAVNNKNCHTVDDIEKETMAGSRCGGCIPLIERIIEVETNRK